MATKKELRAQYKQLRRELPSGTAAELSAAVCEAVVRSQEFRSAATVHLFLPIRRQGEVDTFPILEEIFRRGKTAVVSVSDFSTGEWHTTACAGKTRGREPLRHPRTAPS